MDMKNRPCGRFSIDRFWLVAVLHVDPDDFSGKAVAFGGILLAEITVFGEFVQNGVLHGSRIMGTEFHVIFPGKGLPFIAIGKPGKFENVGCDGFPFTIPPHCAKKWLFYV